MEIPEVIENDMSGFPISPKSMIDLAARLKLIIVNSGIATDIAKTAMQ